MSSKPSFTLERVETTYYPEWGFRPKTPCIPMKMNFVFLNGGMGDYLTWLTPIRWLASEATWIEGTLVGPNYLREIAEYFLKPYPKWSFEVYKSAMDGALTKHPYRGPMELQRESLNATGAHLITCGWVYFTNKEKAPPGWEHYSQFKQEDLDRVELPTEAHNLNNYAVITTGITTNSRKVPGHYWNPVIDHVISKGLTPVFLGKSVVETGNASNIHTKFDPSVDTSKGLDLRDKTTLMQAASILSRAKVVIGHDNGLLHLAGMTSAPIVFGYNLASPEHREPKRPKGKVVNVHLNKDELSCNFCQSKVNFLIGYNFRDCMYGDNQCITMLFSNGGHRWKRAIDVALEVSE